MQIDADGRVLAQIYHLIARFSGRRRPLLTPTQITLHNAIRRTLHLLTSVPCPRRKSRSFCSVADRATQNACFCHPRKTAGPVLEDGLISGFGLAPRSAGMQGLLRVE